MTSAGLQPPSSLGAARARLRSEPALRLAPIALALGWLVAHDTVDAAPGYVLAASARGHSALTVCAMCATAAGAWKAARLRRAGWHRRPWPRRRARLVLGEATVTTAVLLVPYLVVRAASFADAGLPWWTAPDDVVLVAATVLFAWVTVGFALGWRLRAEAAVPIAIVGTYLAMLWPIAVEPLWLRHLGGTFIACCQRDQRLDPGAVQAPIAMAVAAVVVATAIVEARPTLRGAAAVSLTAAVSLVATAFAVGRVDHLGADPVMPRTGPVACAGSSPRVCLWPEQRPQLAHVAAVVGAALRRLEARGVDAPKLVSTRPADRGRLAVTIWIDGTPTADRIILNLADAMAPTITCQDAPTDLWQARALLQAHLALLAGASRQAVDASLGDLALVRSLDRIEQVPPPQGAAWMTSVGDAVDSCRAPTPPMP